EEESDVDSVDLQDTFEITSQISHATQDIPLNQAIKFDSPDTPDNKSNIGKSNKYRILFMSCIVGIAILIVVILIIIFKDNKKGKHYA
ncbi:MAG: hypothetical protein IIY78_07055, partial [Clostridia bacterium]|nr:hypothetical protein [Clostridia bacterium]